MSATANEVTIIFQAIESTLLAGGEGLVDGDSYDGGFSETTTASSADFAIGAVMVLVFLLLQMVIKI